MRVLGRLRFTLPNHSRRHQKLTSLQSFALKSDQQGSAGSHVFHRSCKKMRQSYLKLCWIGCVLLSPFGFGSQGIQPQNNHGRTLAWSVTVHQPDHSTCCMESCMWLEQGRLCGRQSILMFATCHLTVTCSHDHLLSASLGIEFN